VTSRASEAGAKDAGQAAAAVPSSGADEASHLLRWRCLQCRTINTAEHDNCKSCKSATCCWKCTQLGRFPDDCAVCGVLSLRGAKRPAPTSVTGSSVLARGSSGLAPASSALAPSRAVTTKSEERRVLGSGGLATREKIFDPEFFHELREGTDPVLDLVGFLIRQSGKGYSTFVKRAKVVDGSRSLWPTPLLVNLIKKMEFEVRISSLLRFVKPLDLAFPCFEWDGALVSHFRTGCARFASICLLSTSRLLPMRSENIVKSSYDVMLETIGALQSTVAQMDPAGLDEFNQHIANSTLRDLVVRRKGWFIEHDADIPRCFLVYLSGVTAIPVEKLEGGDAAIRSRVATAKREATTRFVQVQRAAFAAVHKAKGTQLVLQHGHGGGDGCAATVEATDSSGLRFEQKHSGQGQAGGFLRTTLWDFETFSDWPQADTDLLFWYARLCGEIMLRDFPVRKLEPWDKSWSEERVHASASSAFLALQLFEYHRGCPVESCACPAPSSQPVRP